MKKYFKLINFKLRLVLHQTDLTKYLEKIISSEKDKGTVNVGNDEELSFENIGDKVKITFKGEEKYIDKVPISFVNEEGETIFKIFDKTSPNVIKEILSSISFDYEFYNKDKKEIKIEELLEKNESVVVLKEKNKELENLFAPLFKIIDITKEDEIIKTSLLLPFESNNLGLNFNSDFQLIIKQRIPLINKIQEYLQNENVSVIKIYGTDGIGKSISYLFLTAINNQNNSIYFNLKDIFNNQCNKKQYFIKSLMKYYRNFDSNNVNDKTINQDISLKYNLYETHKEILEQEPTEDFWELLKIFCEEIEIFANSLIIIDQFKQDFDNNKKLNEIIQYFRGKKNIKFIISSSLNDNTVKEDFISNLTFFFQEKDDNKVETIEEETSVEDIMFKNFSFENAEIKKIENQNNDFSKIGIFNQGFKNIKLITNPEEVEYTNADSEKKKINYPLYDITKIIYINNLISMKNIIKEEDKKYYEIFQYNPKSYNEFEKFLSTNKFKLNEENYIKYLKQKFNNIENKIIEFYKNLKLKNSLEESEENLKGTYIIKLMDIIKEKEIIDLKTLIKYLKIFPFKYLKIYLTDDSDKNMQKINFIDIKKDLNEKKFILDYAYEFVKLAFLNIIYKLNSSTTIDMKELSGSGIGPLLENKIKRYIENIKEPEILIRYFWNFTSTNSDDKKCPEEKYDFKTYKPIEYDDIKNNKIKDFNKYYYIIPDSQTNRSLDAIILIPYANNKFNLICIQITKHKKTVKSKQEYISDCFLAKSKLEKTYGITIENVYFYFILAEDYLNEDTRLYLEIENISYFYFSIRKATFIKYDEIINLTELCKPEARITQELNDDEYKTFENKNELIKLTESFLIKKRKRNEDFDITEQNFEMARNYVFKLSARIYLDYEQLKDMKTIVENNRRINGNFTFTYVYNVNFGEFTSFKRHHNLIGVIVDEKQNKSETKRKYYYYYLNQLYPEGEELNSKIYLAMINGKWSNKRIRERKENYSLKNVPIYFCDSIFVFKIYEVNNK